ncbi:hypothetical protein BkAM31D_09495 [Halalkalibacter krulwichiae]|uniref:Uncharacterized protein n=1 Tax=Halalkalibacter krulwichiae TaxID=199441 RepID=A0A1X9M9I1_9BACI|nr:hypothetical protein BkAM31D_09495 [Halalkalibacter krulwichiae]
MVFSKEVYFKNMSVRNGEQHSIVLLFSSEWLVVLGKNDCRLQGNRSLVKGALFL